MRLREANRMLTERFAASEARNAAEARAKTLEAALAAAEERAAPLSIRCQIFGAPGRTPASKGRRWRAATRPRIAGSALPGGAFTATMLLGGLFGRSAGPAALGGERNFAPPPLGGGWAPKHRVLGSAYP